MKLAFSGPRVSGHNEELDTSGGTGTAIVKKSSANNAQVTEGAFSAVATGDAANLLI